MIEFTIPGIPIAQPRQRHRVVGKFAQNYTPAKHPVQVFKAACQLLARNEYKGAPLQGPVAVSLDCFFPRPQSKVWKTRPMPRLEHTSKPDAENVAKAVLDALTGIVWRDDSQVWSLSVTKWIASGDEQPGTIVLIQWHGEVPV